MNTATDLKLRSYKFISSRIHGYLDYIVGLLLVVSPWIISSGLSGSETWIPFLLGAATILYSLCTDYELGIFRKISLSVHLTFDLLSGLFLAISPWVCGFADSIWIPHLGIGVMECVVVLLTQQKFERDIK